MKSEQKQVTEFMGKVDQATPDMPAVPDASVRALRLRLIQEELRELAEAFGAGQPKVTTDGRNVEWTLRDDYVPTDKSLDDAYDAVIDLLVVVVGTGVALGTELDEGWEEVCAANMRKIIGGYRRADGKWMKPADWQPPNIRRIIQGQVERALARRAHGS